jgi:D-ribulokinase
MASRTKRILKAYLGIDVGTGSVRAALFDIKGQMLGFSKSDIRIWQSAGDMVEQASENIWSSLCAAVREAVAAADVDVDNIVGIGVDATCSLVVVREDGSPLPVGPSGDPNRNIIVWMDHRANAEAERINESAHPLLAYVGGRISPEMQTPKLLWLKKNMPDTFATAGHFFDLSDYLTWRLTGSVARSVCTLTCKWTYLAHERRWEDSYFEAIGLAELSHDYRRIGTNILDPGTPLGRGLTTEAADTIGLIAGTPVAASLIDAHAGAVGTVGMEGSGSVERTLAYILGTSACAMASARLSTPVPGLWGPYYSAMIPGFWLNEAGQSAAGAAIDYLLEIHPALSDARNLASERHLSLSAWLEDEATATCKSPSKAAYRARHIHVVPDFNGNRSPFAEPEARAAISGLRMDRSISGLLDLYVAGLCSLGYGLCQIIAALRSKHFEFDRLVVSGGMAQSKLVRQILADTTNLPVVTPLCSESVLLGAAMLGATAAGAYPNLSEAMWSMSRVACTQNPDGSVFSFHQLKAAAFLELQNTERSTRRLLQTVDVV